MWKSLENSEVIGPVLHEAGRQAGTYPPGFPFICQSTISLED